MPFYRFEDLESHRFNPHLSTAEGPVVEGEFMYFGMVTKRAGTGSELHYHPNELMAFPLQGKINCMVGRDRRIVPPGTFVHIPPFARHGFKACEDGDLRYLYIKDRTWTLIGAAADEALPDKALSAREVAKAVNAGRYPGQEKDASKSGAILDGLGLCYYPMIEALDAPAASGHCERWVEGTNIGFGFVESPPGYVSEATGTAHEMFLYIVRGTLDVKVGKQKRRADAGDVIHIPKSASYHFRVTGNESVRYAAVRSTPRLEREISEKGAADNWRG